MEKSSLPLFFRKSRTSSKRTGSRTPGFPIRKNSKHPWPWGLREPSKPHENPGPTPKQGPCPPLPHIPTDRYGKKEKKRKLTRAKSPIAAIEPGRHEYKATKGKVYRRHDFPRRPRAPRVRLTFSTSKTKFMAERQSAAVGHLYTRRAASSPSSLEILMFRQVQDSVI